MINLFATMCHVILLFFCPPFFSLVKFVVQMHVIDYIECIFFSVYILVYVQELWVL
jgi:hypothetical protein